MTTGLSRLAAYRATLTQEDKDNLLLLARQGREAKAAFRLANKHLLKQDSLDAPHWASLGSKHGVRMPSNDDPVSVRGLRKAMRKANVDVEVWNAHYTSAQYFVDNNPKWTMYAAQGLVLELLEDISKAES